MVQSNRLHNVHVATGGPIVTGTVTGGCGGTSGPGRRGIPVDPGSFLLGFLAATLFDIVVLVIVRAIVGT